MFLCGLTFDYVVLRVTCYVLLFVGNPQSSSKTLEAMQEETKRLTAAADAIRMKIEQQKRQITQQQQQQQPQQQPPRRRNEPTAVIGSIFKVGEITTFSPATQDAPATYHVIFQHDNDDFDADLDISLYAAARERYAQPIYLTYYSSSSSLQDSSPLIICQFHPHSLRVLLSLLANLSLTAPDLSVTLLFFCFW